MLKIEAPYAPVEPIFWEGLAEKKITLFLKREDYAHPHISGNKWRKLKHQLLFADRHQKKLLVTFGGAYSNHLLATAAAGAKYGFKTTGFVRGEKVSNAVLNLCELFGMELLFVSRENYRNKEELFSSRFGLNPSALMIPEGGAGSLGELGVSEILEEEVFNEMAFTDIVCSVGTGSTLKGLLQGIDKANLSAIAHGIVVLKGAEEMNKEFESFNPNRYLLHHRFHGGGYGKSNEALIQFIYSFAGKTGILLDQVYEAKMMLGILTLVEEDYFKPGSKILALHNGGTIGLTGLR